MVLYFLVFCISISCKNGGLAIFLPNNFSGEFYIVEDKKDYQYPEGRALENFGDYVYELKENENIIKVKNIKIFKTRRVLFSYIYLAPILLDDRIDMEWENDKKIKIKIKGE
jgi:hypothetical protein